MKNLFFILIILLFTQGCNFRPPSSVPEIEIKSLKDGDICPHIVLVSGQIHFNGAYSDETTFLYEVSGTTISESFKPIENEFSFILSTETFPQSFRLLIKAETMDTSVECSLLLRKEPGNSLPTFQARYKEGFISFTCPVLPKTSGYELYYYINTEYPLEEEKNFIDLQFSQGDDQVHISSLSVEAFTPGDLYTFCCKTIPEPGWPECISQKIGFIYYTAETIDLKLSEKTLSWNNIAGTNKYQVYRRFSSLENNSDYMNFRGFEPISEIISTTTFTDMSAVIGEEADYRIKPYVKNAL